MDSDRQEEQGTAPSERRLHRRAIFRSLQVRGESKKLFFTGHVRNLSLGGLFIQSTSPKPVGTRLRLQIPLERGFPPIEVAAEVVWIQPFDVRSKTPPGMGLRFSELDAKSARRIEMFLEQNALEAEKHEGARRGPGRAGAEPSDRG